MTDVDKAIRAAKLTLGAVLDKRRAKTAVERAQGQIAPSKYLPDVPRQVHADGGRIAANKGGSMGARADFLVGNHPEVPNVVYHSTKADFHQFNPMSHFGTRQSAHDRYSPDAQLNENMSIIPAHISLKNPLDVGLENNWQNNQQTIRQAADVMFKSENPSREYLQAAEKLYDLAHNPFIRMPEVERRGAEILREAGHDGIIYTNNIEDPGSRSFITLGPEQVKSAVGNRGTFDPTNPDMTYADGGRIGYTDGGAADDDNQPIDLGAAREQKQVQGFHKGLMGDIASAASERMDAHQKAIDAGVFDGYEVGDTLQGSAHPMRITGRFVRPWKPSTTVLSHFDRMGAKPTIIEHNGKQYIPMLRYQTGKEGVDGFQEGDAYLDGVKTAGYRKMGGLRAVKADGGSVDDEDEGVDAYHGSPHDFDAFDISKLGTGEGAQSYGHGLYFAGNEGVAKSYRNALSDTLIHPEGTPDLEKRAGQMALTFSDNTPEGALQWLSKFKNGATHTSPAMTPELVEAVSKRFSSGEFRPGGHMYKVRLRVKPHELLDWDKPMSQQHPNVQAAIKAIGVDTGAREWKTGANLGNGNRLIVTPHPDLPDDEQFAKYEMETPVGARIKLHRQDVERLLGKGGDLTGGQVHQRLIDMGNRDGAIGEHLRADNPMKTGPKWAAEALMRHGIKGIRYRDAMSRNKEDGDATHNYVMFHHDPVKVVDKYEYGGAVGKSEGGSMGDDENRPVDLGVTRALRRFNQNSDGPPPEVEGIFNRLAAAKDAAQEAHEIAHKAGAFDSAQIGDVFKYKPLDSYAPMKVIGHGMEHVSRWGGINPPKYVYNDHFPVAYFEYQDARKERGSRAVELLEDRNLYNFISGKPRVHRADGGRLSLYSKAAQIIRGMKDQPMQAADILKYALGKGAKKTEIAHVDVPPGKATPSQVAEHIEFMQPQIGVHKRETFYRYNDPERYERQIDYLERQGRHDEAEELTREFEAFEGYGGKDAPIYAKYQLPGGENYREHVLTLDNHPDDQTYTAPIHWGKMKNPLAHIRMSTRMIGNKKILHIEEMQSDWNNDARKVGFRTGREKQDYEDYVAQMRQKAIDRVKARTGQDYYDPMTGETAPTMSPMVAQAQIEKYQRMDPYTLALKMGMHDEHRRMADAAKGGSGVPRAPYINPEKDDVYEMAMKHVLMEAAKGGYDGIAFTPDEEQELRWPGHTFKGIYNKRLPGIAQRLVQPHDLDTDTDDMTHLNGWAVPMIPLSEKARDSITQNGFSSFRRGGAVGYEDGGSVTPDIQNPMSIFPKPQRMFPEDQRPAGGQYLSMPSKTDVTGHKAEAATIGVAPGGKPFFRASQNAVDQTGSTGRGTATAKTNLFKQKAGWRWAQAPEGHEATDTIVSVEHRGKHYYTLNAHFPKGVDLARYENAPSEPRLRPTTRGNVEIGPQAGSILVRGREHPVYHHVIVKADGGAVDAALAATRRFTKDGQHVTMRLKD